jgi:hypothetical protein
MWKLALRQEKQAAFSIEPAKRIAEALYQQDSQSILMLMERGNIGNLSAAAWRGCNRTRPRQKKHPEVEI